MSAFLPALRPALPFRWSNSMTRGWMIGALIALPGAFAACSYLLAGSGAQPTPVQALSSGDAGRGSALIRVSDLQGQRLGDFLTVTGSAQNLSRRSLRDAEAVVEWFGTDGKLAAIETALLEFPVMKPGDQSPFRVLARCRPEVSAFRVRFRSLNGASLPSEDAARP